jgi:hypothetical protein
VSYIIQVSIVPQNSNPIVSEIPITIMHPSSVLYTGPSPNRATDYKIKTVTVKSKRLENIQNFDLGFGKAAEEVSETPSISSASASVRSGYLNMGIEHYSGQNFFLFLQRSQFVIIFK